MQSFEFFITFFGSMLWVGVLTLAFGGLLAWLAPKLGGFLKGGGK